MKKTPKKFYIKKPVKIKKNKSGGAIPRFARLELPSIFRIIPARLNRVLSHIDRFTLISFTSGILVMLLAIALFDLQLDNDQLRIARQRKDELSKERDYWQQVVGEHEGYRDGYYMLAVSEYRLSNTNQALVNIEKALEIDPLFEQGRLFKGKLQEK